MADSNMTISKEIPIVQGTPSRLRKVIFTQTSSGTAGNATTTFPITGELLRVETSGGDGAWDFTLNDGITNVFAITGINTAGTANTWPIYQTAGGGVITDDDSNFAYGVPMVGQTLLCTIANGGTNAIVITVTYRASESI
jgi:hypothetical protein